MMASIRRLLKKYRQLIAYGLVGCCNTLVDFLAFTLLHAALRLPPYLCQAGGYTAGIVCSFLLNRKYTFDTGGKGVWRQVLLFMTVNLITLGVSSWAITALVALGVNAYLAKIAVTLIVMIMNFLGYKYIVFREGGAAYE